MDDSIEDRIEREMLRVRCIPYDALRCSLLLGTVVREWMDDNGYIKRAEGCICDEL